MLRIDSPTFLGGAALLVLALRTLPAPVGRAVYALVSGAIYLWLLPNSKSVALALGFLYWPWVWLRSARQRPTWALGVVFAVQVGVLLWVRKYFALLPAWAGSVELSHTFAIVGVSYIILRQVELVLWVDANPQTPIGWVDYTGFTIGLFTLLAGPILRYQDFQRAFGTRDEPETRRSLALALNRVVNGYLKVSVLSPILFDLSSLSMLEHAAATGPRLAFFYLFPLYVYVNFSGYCDVVIGFGRLGRFRIPENFDHPFLATNIQNYWQRWHITFSQWIRNQLFFPLVRALRSLGVAWVRASATLVAAWVTFVLVGLWHGTDPGFAVFGMLHGVAVIAVAPYGKLLDRWLSPGARERYETSRLVRVVRVAACYHYLCFTMLFFERPLAEMAKWWG